MKILIADDQELVLLSLEKSLIMLDYTVICARNVKDAKNMYDITLPDLVIADLNMPLTNNSEAYNNNSYENPNGLELVNYIKNEKGNNTPVLILSGNVSEEVIVKGFDLGADDFMKKPLSLLEIGARVKRLIGVPETALRPLENDRYIQNNCIGVVIPCYNEEKRLLSQEFLNFIRKNSGYHLCFVNDGSTDNTLQILRQLAQGNQGYISVYNCEKNGGKAEAVRLGMLHLSKQTQFNYIGFLDADLSTNFEDFEDLVKTISNSEYKIVSGSRMARMGANIEKESSRAIISKTINFFIRKTLGMNFKDTQCGAKIMTKEVVRKTFEKRFLTKWLFDVEIFMRMRKIYGLQDAQKQICEVPLKRWIHADGSKLSFKDSVKIAGQIGQIAVHYR